jgi:16S rRNA (uracil1498-N3)-methyltransferase
VNLILFEREETGRLLPAGDPRAVHLLEVLRRQPGDRFDAGLINGPRGKGTLVAIRAEGLELAFAWETAVASLDPIVLIVGLPRPQSARRILREAAALGVGTLHFVRTEKAEASYALSPLWATGEWRRHLVAGAEQAFTTRLPEVTFARTLADVVAAPDLPPARLALDLYEAPQGLAAAAVGSPVALALGPERGWSAADRDLLRSQGFTLVHLGSRVLRTETACVAAVALIKAKLGLFS